MIKFGNLEINTVGLAILAIVALPSCAIIGMAIQAWAKAQGCG